MERGREGERKQGRDGGRERLKGEPSKTGRVTEKEHRE